MRLANQKVKKKAQKCKYSRFFIRIIATVCMTLNVRVATLKTLVSDVLYGDPVTSHRNLVVVNKQV
jgi:hypothetical protein